MISTFSSDIGPEYHVIDRRIPCKQDYRFSPKARVQTGRWWALTRSRCRTRQAAAQQRGPHTARMPEARADIQPELWVSDGHAAVAFYEHAFGAAVEHRVVGPEDGDLIAQLSVGGARFWVSSASGELGRFSPDAIGGATGRMLLVVD